MVVDSKVSNQVTVGNSFLLLHNDRSFSCKIVHRFGTHSGGGFTGQAPFFAAHTGACCLLRDRAESQDWGLKDMCVAFH